MSATMKSLGIDNLSVEDRLSLVQEIWDSIAEDAGEIPLSDAQKAEIDRRLAAHRANPEAARRWEDVEADLTERLRE